MYFGSPVDVIDTEGHLFVEGWPLKSHDFYRTNMGVCANPGLAEDVAALAKHLYEHLPAHLGRATEV